ncbi:MAG: TonB-dependent receptor plug domain-containing protein, partial [Odoribacter sp.]|nr:TonB-dependent receptor plug domain-containing protein [Odoribacter sp.]
MVRLFFYRSGLCLLSLGSVFYRTSAQTVDTTRVHELQQVEVSAVRRPSVVRSTAPLQVMSGAEMERLGYQSLADAVRRFSGVTVKDYGGIGGLKTVSVRSLGAHHTGVMYDGVVVGNCQAGQIDIGRFSLDNVSQVSLAVGQEDDIFQPARMFASAGVLSIRTQRPEFRGERDYSLQLRVKGGSFGMVNPSLRYARRLTSKTSLSVDGDFLRADGTYPFTLKNGQLVTREKRYNSDILSWHTEANLYTTFRDSSALMAKAYYFQSERGLPGGGIYYNPYNKERVWDRNFFAQTGY